MKVTEATRDVFFLDERGKSELRSFLSPSCFPEAISVFESMRTYKGVIFLLREHLDRLKKSAQTIGLKIPHPKPVLENFIFESYAKTSFKEAFLRLTVLKDQVFLFIEPLIKKDLSQGVSIQVTSIKRNTSNSFAPEAKTSSYLNAVLARLEACEAHEVIFLNTQGFVAEGLISNLFMVKKSQLKTAPSVGILDGLTRSFVIKLARSLKINVEETWLTRHDLYNADEVFLTYSSAEIVPVRQIDGRMVGRVVPGIVTRQLKSAYQASVQTYVSKHKIH